METRGVATTASPLGARVDPGVPPRLFYLEIGSEADLIALHGPIGAGGAGRAEAVEIVSGWDSDEPYDVIAREVASERAGENVWVLLWTDTAGRGKARSILAIAESERYDHERAMRRASDLLVSLRRADASAEPMSHARAEPVSARPASMPVAAQDEPSLDMDVVALGELWRAVIGDLDEVAFHRRAVLRSTLLRAIVDDTALVGVPDAFTADIVESALRPALTEALTRRIGRSVQLAVSILRPSDSTSSADRSRLRDEYAVNPISDRSSPTGQSTRETSPSGADLDQHGGANGRTAASSDFLRLDPNLTFETFVVNASNRFAHAASFAVAEAPGKAYNPLFVYGGSGLGKTHLLHAIGHYTISQGTAKTVRYVSAEEFTHDFFNSLRDGNLNMFRHHYREIDILLMTDVQFLENRERPQEEFFHTFNTLHNANKQIVITSDRSPKQLGTLEDRLRTRFEWGLLADIQPPDLETRIAILQKKAAQERLLAPAEVLEFIASRIANSIRELEGALIRVSAFASLNRRVVDLALAEEVLGNFIPDDSGSKLTADQIMKATAEYFGVSVDDLRGQSRSREFVNARQIAIYLCRELTDLRLDQIGQAFGGRDHTMVMHADRKIRQQMAERRSLYNQIVQLTNIAKRTAHTEIYDTGDQIESRSPHGSALIVRPATYRET
jgi:chromosomal replication initiator protein DnaA